MAFCGGRKRGCDLGCGGNADRAEQALVLGEGRGAEVADCDVRRCGKDSELAAQSVGDLLANIAGEGDDGLPAVGFDVAAEARDLEALAADEQRHRAVLDAGRDGADAGPSRRAHHLVRRGVGGDVARGLVHQGVAYRSSDEERLEAGARHRRAGILGPRVLEPWGGNPGLVVIPGPPSSPYLCSD
jgi:hypothetical protein